MTQENSPNLIPSTNQLDIPISMSIEAENFKKLDLSFVDLKDDTYWQNCEYVAVFVLNNIMPEHLLAITSLWPVMIDMKKVDNDTVYRIMFD